MNQSYQRANVRVEQPAEPQLFNQGRSAEGKQAQQPPVFDPYAGTEAGLKNITTEVKFMVKCKKTQVGDQLAVVGNIAALGNWDTEEAKFLETCPERFPCWDASIVVPRDIVIEYKYIIVSYPAAASQTSESESSEPLQVPIPQFRKPVQKTIEWEQFGLCNRKFNTIGKKKIILQEKFNNTRCIEDYVETDKSRSFLGKRSDIVAGSDYLNGGGLQPHTPGLPVLQPESSSISVDAQQHLQQTQQNLGPYQGSQRSNVSGSMSHLPFSPKLPGFRRYNTLSASQPQLHQNNNHGTVDLSNLSRMPLDIQSPSQMMLPAPRFYNLGQTAGTTSQSERNKNNVMASMHPTLITQTMPLVNIDRALQVTPQRSDKAKLFEDVSRQISASDRKSSKSRKTKVTRPKSILEDLEEERSQESTARQNRSASQKKESAGPEEPQKNPSGEQESSKVNSRQLQSSSQRNSEVPSIVNIPKNTVANAAGTKKTVSGQGASLRRDSAMTNDFQFPMSPQEEEMLVQPQVSLDPKEPIMLCSFLLPYTVERNHKTGDLEIQKCFHNPTVLYGTLENMMQNKQFNFHWIGLVTTLEDVSDQEKQQLRSKFLEYNASPVFMTSQEIEPFLVFYENILRPLFHNFKDIRDLRLNNLQYWKEYLHVNQLVAQKILEIKNTKIKNLKTIWIQNNHLLMVPLYVKKQFEQANIGIFFHSPWPSSAHFRTHKYRFEILKSLLQCDLVAFHLFVYARNFFKTCNRLCGLEIEFRRGGFLGINFHGKHVMIRVSHIGIEESFLEQKIKSKEFKSMKNQLDKYIKQVGINMTQNRLRLESQSYNSKTMTKKEKENAPKPIIIASIDSYHPISGLKNKLLSYQYFLRTYPLYQNRTVLIQFVGSVVQAFDKDGGHYRNVAAIKLRKKCMKIKDEIHREFGTECLIFQESNPSIEKRFSLWCTADVLLCSSLRDGLCIPVFEYTKCRMMANKLKSSSMMCSEFAGCHEALRGVHIYNPFSLQDFVKTMDKALSQTPQEKEDNMLLAYQYVKRSNVSKWVEGFLLDLKLSYQPIDSSFYLGLNFQNNQGQHQQNRYLKKTTILKLNIDTLVTSFLKAQKCLFFIEIRALPHLKFSKHSIPTKEVIEQLHGLLIDPRNTVVILGNHNQEKIEEWFGRNAANNYNNFWLVAESGYLYRPGNNQIAWNKVSELGDMSWLPQVRKLMQAYCDNVDGSFVEERQSAILWNYKNTEQEHGTMFVQQIYFFLEKLIQNHTAGIHDGKGYIEVYSTGVRKQKVVKLLLDRISQNSQIDFILCLGNDSSDEDVYALLKSEKVAKKYLSPQCSKYICTLEKKPSEADYYIEQVESVRPLLEKLYNATKKRKKIRSFADLTVLRKNQSPFAKISNMLQGANKTNSIANLEQYLQSNIMPNDNNMTIPAVTDTVKNPFISKQGFAKQSFGHHSASPKVIEEAQDEMSQQNDLFCTDPNKNKYPSMENKINKNHNNQSPKIPTEQVSPGLREQHQNQKQISGTPIQFKSTPNENENIDRQNSTSINAALLFGSMQGGGVQVPLSFNNNISENQNIPYAHYKSENLDRDHSVLNPSEQEKGKNQQYNPFSEKISNGPVFPGKMIGVQNPLTMADQDVLSVGQRQQQQSGSDEYPYIKPNLPIFGTHVRSQEGDGSHKQMNTANQLLTQNTIQFQQNNSNHPYSTMGLVQSHTIANSMKKIMSQGIYGDSTNHHIMNQQQNQLQALLQQKNENNQALKANKLQQPTGPKYQLDLGAVNLQPNIAPAQFIQKQNEKNDGLKSAPMNMQKSPSNMLTQLVDGGDSGGSDLDDMKFVDDADEISQ